MEINGYYSNEIRMGFHGIRIQIQLITSGVIKHGQLENARIKWRFSAWKIIDKLPRLITGYSNWDGLQSLQSSYSLSWMCIPGIVNGSEPVPHLYMEYAQVTIWSQMAQLKTTSYDPSTQQFCQLINVLGSQDDDMTVVFAVKFKQTQRTF